MKRLLKTSFMMAIAASLCLQPAPCRAEAKKGLLVYDSIYSSTAEVAYWLKAIIGVEQPLDVKKLDQVITVEPYDYVIIGSYSKWEKPSPRIYKFIEYWKNELAKKQVCYFLLGGDWDETMLLKAPGAPIKLIAGRNYLFDLKEKFPDIKPVVISGFGGRQVMPTLNGSDGFMIWVLEKLSREGAHWVGLDIWESLVPARVEVYGNDIRTKILGLAPLPPAEVQKYRGFWNSLQPASLQDPSKVKTTNLISKDNGETWTPVAERPYTLKLSSKKSYYSRSRIKADLPAATRLITDWAVKDGFVLKEERAADYMIWYTAMKQNGGKEDTISIVMATMPDDPGNVHVSFRSWLKPEQRKALEDAAARAEELLWADGRQVPGR